MSFFHFRSNKTKNLKYHLKDEKTEVGAATEGVVDGGEITKVTGTNEEGNEIEVNEDGVEKVEVVTSVISHFCLEGASLKRAVASLPRPGNGLGAPIPL